MAPAIILFSAAPEMKLSVVGARVLYPVAFLALLRRQMEAGLAQKSATDRTLWVPMPPEVLTLVSSGFGPRSDDLARYHLQGDRCYLRREHAFPARGCRAIIQSIDDFMRENGQPEGTAQPGVTPPVGTTHVLIRIEIYAAADHPLSRKETNIVADEELQ